MARDFVTLSFGRSMLAWAIEAGRELIAVKAAMKHGEFGEWCRGNLTFTERHARRYMRLAKSDTDVRFDPDLGIKAALEAIAESRPTSPPPSPSFPAPACSS